MAVVIAIGFLIISSMTSSMTLRSIAASPALATNFSNNEGKVHQFEATARFNRSMAIVVVVLLSTFFFMGFVAVYVRKCVVSERERDIAYQRAPGASQRQLIQGLNKETIGSFPVVRFSLVQGLDKGKSPIECTVCLTEFQEQENVRVLPNCGHFFHLDCIDMWLFSHTTCPLCRQNLVLNPHADYSNIEEGYISERRIGESGISIFTESINNGSNIEEGFASERRIGESRRNTFTQSINNGGHEVRLTLIDAPRQNEVPVDSRGEARGRESIPALPENSVAVKFIAEDLEKFEKLLASATDMAKPLKIVDGSSSVSASLIKSTSTTLLRASQSCSMLDKM